MNLKNLDIYKFYFTWCTKTNGSISSIIISIYYAAGIKVDLSSWVLYVMEVAKIDKSKKLPDIL